MTSWAGRRAHAPCPPCRTSSIMGSTVTDMSTVRQSALTASAREVAASEHRIMKAVKMKNLAATVETREMIARR